MLRRTTRVALTCGCPRWPSHRLDVEFGHAWIDKRPMDPAALAPPTSADGRGVRVATLVGILRLLNGGSSDIPTMLGWPSGPS